MKKNHCFIVKPACIAMRSIAGRLLHCFLAVVFVSLLVFHSPSLVYADEDGGSAPQPGSIGSAGSSLKTFQTIVKKAEETGETNLQWYLGSDNGTMEGITNGLTG